MSDFTPFGVIPKTTRLSPDLEKMYKSWVIENKVPVSNDYDMRGYFRDTLMGKAAPTEINISDNQMHFPDTYKLPNHPSFSNESIYAKPGESRHWVGNYVNDRNQPVSNLPPYKENTWALQDKGGNIKVEVPLPQVDLYQGQPDLPLESMTTPIEDQLLLGKFAKDAPALIKFLKEKFKK